MFTRLCARIARTCLQLGVFVSDALGVPGNIQSVTATAQTAGQPNFTLVFTLVGSLFQGLYNNGIPPYIGQVGWNTWEDIYVGKPGKNFGWPCFEGNFQQAGYAAYATCTSLYSANETDRAGEHKEGTVSAFAVNRADGKLELLNTVRSGGAGPTVHRVRARPPVARSVARGPTG